jgi:hypothetical protein
MSFIIGSMFFYLVITSLVIAIKKPSNEILFTTWYAFILIFMLVSVLVASSIGIAAGVGLFLINSYSMGVMLKSNKTKNL